MFEEVVGDDEINRFRLDRRQQLAVVDDINRHELLVVDSATAARAPSFDQRIGRPHPPV